MLKRLALFFVLLFIAIPTLHAQSSTPGKTVLDGVYTDAQAERGRLSFASTCGRCHGSNLEGIAGPTLAGEHFIEHWREDTLDSMFNFMRTGMPPGRNANSPNPIADGAYLDMLAFVLKVNEYPAGNVELTADNVGDAFLILKSGPRPVPDGSLVLTVGCLSQTPTGQWVLFNATEPTRNRNANESTAAELLTSSNKRPGTLIFRLADLDAVPDFVPEDHKGHKMQAKGFIVRQPNAERINLSAMTVVDSACGQ